jgi:AraC family transcriptional regulator
MLDSQNLLQLTQYLARSRLCPTDLSGLARRAGWSRFHLQRQFKKRLGESPKRFSQRLQLESAAALLLTSDNSIIDIALACGYNSHEVFLRGFRKHFDCSPSDYRQRMRARLTDDERQQHASLIQSAGPCLNLYQIRTTKRRTTMTMSKIERKEAEATPILYIQARVPRTELQPLFAKSFGEIFGLCMKKGYAMAGHPMARYVDFSQAMVTVDCILPLQQAGEGEGDIQAGELQAGPVAFAVHSGPYEELQDTYAAIEKWIDEQGLQRNGPPWEWYVTDPGSEPDPQKWQTEVYYPITP